MIPQAKALRALSLWLPVAAYAAVIFLVSSNAFSSVFFRKVQKMHGDWLVHIVEYTLLGFLLARALGSGRKAGFPGIGFVLTVVFLGTLYGISDEFHQSFVPNRTPSPLDVAADGVGVWLGCMIWLERRKRSYA